MLIHNAEARMRSFVRVQVVRLFVAMHMQL